MVHLRNILMLVLFGSLAACGTLNQELVTGVGAGLSIDVVYIRPINSGVGTYSAKFVCGETETDDPLVRAIYRTEISTFNERDDESIGYSWRIGFVYPATPPASPPQDEIRGPFRGQEFNCRDIRKALESTPKGQSAREYQKLIDAPLIKGFLLINSKDTALIVTGIYSALHKQVHGPQVADLLPINKSTQENQPFCTIVSDNNLVVTIKNDGIGSAPETTTRVTLGLPGSPEFNLATPELDPGESTDLEPIPLNGAQQIQSSMAFEIFADAPMALGEIDEGNNIANGVCEFF